jgi:hypothetical protein
MTNKIVTKAISMLTTPAMIKNENLIMLPGNEKIDTTTIWWSFTKIYLIKHINTKKMCKMMTVVC